MNTKQITRPTALVLAALLVFAMIGFSQIASAQDNLETEIPAIGHTNPEESELSTQSGLSTQAWATHCQGKIKAIQTQTQNILIRLENSRWMLLAKYGNTHASTARAASMLSTALTAQAQDKTIQLRFHPSVSCTAKDNYTSHAWMIRLIK